MKNLILLPRGLRVFWGKCFLHMLGRISTDKFYNDLELINILKEWVEADGQLNIRTEMKKGQINIPFGISIQYGYTSHSVNPQTGEKIPYFFDKVLLTGNVVGRFESGKYKGLQKQELLSVTYMIYGFRITLQQKNKFVPFYE